MSLLNDKPVDASTLTPREQQAIDNINEALDFDADPGLWADCGECDAPVLISAVQRLQREVKESQEKNMKLMVERDAAILYAKAHSDRLSELLALTMKTLPSYEDMLNHEG